MATTPAPAGPEGARRRRVVSRRGGMAFSGSSLAQSSQGSGVAGDANEDEVDDAIDVDSVDLNASVAARAVATPRLTEDAENDIVRRAGNSEDYTPQARLAAVGQRSSEYEREYRLHLLHRMLTRGTPLDEIASALGVSVSTVMRDRKELTERLRRSAKELDIDVIVGNSTGFYQDVQAMALRAASNANVPMPMRLAGMRTALAAHNDMHRFYQASGVYDVLRFRKGAGEGQSSDIQRLMQMTEDMLSETRRSDRTGGAPGLGDFSGDDAEVMSL